MRPRKYFLISVLFILFFIDPQQTFPQTPDGDLAPLGNRDGIVTVGDALVALRFALGLETPTQDDIAHGDVAPLDNSGLPSPDGQITVGDALVILRNALGLISLTPTGVSGLWTISLTQTGETEENGSTILLFQTDTDLSLEIITLAAASITGTATLTGTQIALSWQEAEKTVSLTGTVVTDTMSGTWTDTSGGAGTWQAQRAIEIGEATISYPETGNVLLTVEEEYSIGSATFYGTQTEQGPVFPLTGFTMTTPEGECVVTLDDQERPLTMTMGTMEVTFTYNEDDTFNYELKENGSLMYSGSAVSTEGGNSTKSAMTRADRSHHSVGIGALPAEQPLRYVRSNGSEGTGIDKVISDYIRMCCLIYNIPNSLANKLEKIPQLRNLALIDLTLHITNNRSNIYNHLKSYDQLLTLHVKDIVINVYEEDKGGDDYDFDLDGFTENQGDCNDRDPNEFPAQVWLKDADGDGYSDGNFKNSCLRPEGYKLPSELTSTEPDCDDTDAARNPGLKEVCDDLKDNDCDELVDCDDPDCVNDPACPQCPRPGDPADYTQPCEGHCIPAGADCCYGKGGWCAPGKKCWDGGCCPLERICDNVVCMPEGCVCCNRGDGTYCPIDAPQCCPECCCPQDRTCCGRWCCKAGEKCCNNLGCCPNDSTCCGSSCCPSGYFCCEDKLGCCKVGMCAAARNAAAPG